MTSLPYALLGMTLEKINMILHYLLVVLAFLSACSKTSQGPSLQGDFVIEDGDRATLNLSLWSEGHLVVGRHVFVTQGGNRIDFCDEDSISIRLRKLAYDTYDGTLHDWYSDEINKIKVIHREPKLTLIHTGSSHSLVDDTLEFTRRVD
jgi:hypothetical protein